MDDELVIWNDDFSVGFEPIDKQHKELAMMTNELFEQCKQGASAADKTFFQTIKKAGDYARIHFSDEEKYMQQAKFPNIREHIKQHSDFLDTVIKSLSDFEAGKTAPIELARFLKKWLLNHIAVSDKEYAPYLAKL